MVVDLKGLPELCEVIRVPVPKAGFLSIFIWERVKEVRELWVFFHDATVPKFVNINQSLKTITAKIKEKKNYHAFSKENIVFHGQIIQ